MRELGARNVKLVLERDRDAVCGAGTCQSAGQQIVSRQLTERPDSLPRLGEDRIELLGTLECVIKENLGQACGGKRIRTFSKASWDCRGTDSW